MSMYRPHDLLWVAPGALGDACPGWADAAWPVVVRREDTGPQRIPVGLRGLARNQRWPAYVAVDAVVRCATPEMLAASRAHVLPAVLGAALDLVTAGLHGAGLAWGPGGSAGFYLATGVPVLRASSDLDIILRAPAPFTPGQRACLELLLAAAPCRLDVQVDTGGGGFALAEWLRGGRVMVKTAAGPVLCADPWRGA
jgi:phosphoribosyl-dephospho-CoA transferase